MATFYRRSIWEIKRERRGDAIPIANVAPSESCFTTHLSQPIMSTRLVHKKALLAMAASNNLYYL
jgi:hypothetical protein